MRINETPMRIAYRAVVVFFVFDFRLYPSTAKTTPISIIPPTNILFSQNIFPWVVQVNGYVPIFGFPLANGYRAVARSDIWKEKRVASDGEKPFVIPEFLYRLNVGMS
jgi:hypothetical protein